MHLSSGQVQDITPIPLKGSDVRVDRTEPLFFSPQDPHHLYYAANRLYETTDGGQHWNVASPDLTRENPGVPASVGPLHVPKAAAQRGAIYAASASALQGGLIWAGTDDGLVWMTRDGARNWQNVTPAQLTPWSKVTQIEASHFDPQAAYVSVSRFRLDDRHPYVYRTRDGGQSWQLIAGGLPDDGPVNTVREDTVRRGLLFAGTEKSVWVSFDDGDHWGSLQLNLPHTSMRDLAVQDQDLIVATHGRSFWVLDDIAPLRQFTAALAAGEAALLQPGPALRARRSTGTDTPLQPDEPTGRNPPDGAVIDYYLSRAAHGPVTIEVLDSTGTVVRRASSADPPEFTAGELARELIPAYWIRMPRPPGTGAGMHRWLWDLHYPAPRTARRGFPISAVPGDTPREPAGPLASPGDYRVRLRIGARSWETRLRVEADPRVGIGAAEYAAQFALAQRLATALDGITGALLEAHSIRAQLQDSIERGGAGAAGGLKTLDLDLAALLEPDEKGGAPRGLERLSDQVATLYAQVTGVDAAPTEAQRSGADAVLADWRIREPQWRRLRDGELPALNRRLVHARLPSIRSDLEAPRDPNIADEE
jgi:hypothetical protein